MQKIAEEMTTNLLRSKIAAATETAMNLRGSAELNVLKSESRRDLDLSGADNFSFEALGYGRIACFSCTLCFAQRDEGMLKQQVRVMLELRFSDRGGERREMSVMLSCRGPPLWLRCQIRLNFITCKH